MTELKRFIIILTVLFLVLLEFFYLNPNGIKLGYYLSGGHKTTATITSTPAEIKRDYEEMVAVYTLYKNDDNEIAKRWSDTAKQKANSLAKEYNNLMDEYILEEIK